MNMVTRTLKQQITRLTSLIFLFFLASCINDGTLERFDLGKGRSIKVKTGTYNIGVQINYEMYVEQMPIQQCFLFLTSDKRSEIKKLKFQLVSDRSSNIFALFQTEPEKRQLAVFDFSNNFRYPCCTNEKGNSCRIEYNRLIEILEKDNPEINFKRVELR